VTAAATRQNALTSLSNGDTAATANGQNALTSLSGVGAATATSQKALTSLSGVGAATATSQKALTSLAVAEQDILGRSAGSAPSDRACSATTRSASEVRPFSPPGSGTFPSLGTVRIVGPSWHPDVQTVSTIHMARAVERAERWRGRE